MEEIERDVYVRTHEQRMSNIEADVRRCEEQRAEHNREQRKEMKEIRTELTGLRTDVSTELNATLRAITNGVAGEAREAKLTANALHGRIDQLESRVGSMASELGKLAGKVALLLTALGGTGFVGWKLLP